MSSNALIKAGDYVCAHHYHAGYLIESKGPAVIVPIFKGEIALIVSVQFSSRSVCSVITEAGYVLSECIFGNDEVI